MNAAHLQLAPGPGPASRRPASPIRVVLADHHAAARRSLRLLLDTEGDFQVLAEAGDLSTAVDHLADHRPHVVVIDPRTPNGSTLETIRRLRAQAPATEVVVLTMEESPAFAQQALDAGAAALVLKERSDRDLPEAVRQAARGAEYVSPRVAVRLEALRRVVPRGLRGHLIGS